MTPQELNNQRMMDEEIMQYIRGLQDEAPIRAEAVHQYLVTMRRRKVRLDQVVARLNYLEQAGYILSNTDYYAGEGYAKTYLLTADGGDVLDGARPWR